MTIFPYRRDWKFWGVGTLKGPKFKGKYEAKFPVGWMGGRGGGGGGFERISSMVWVWIFLELHNIIILSDMNLDMKRPHS